PAALHRAQVTREEVDGQRSDNVKLLFRAERPAAFDNAVVHIVGEKDEVCPTVGLRRRAQNEGDRQDRDKEEVIERPDSEAATKHEAANIHGASTHLLLPKLPTDEEAAEDKEKVDADPTVGDKWQPGVDGRSIFGREVIAEMAADDEQNCDGTQAVEEWNLTGGRMHQLGKRAREQIRNGDAACPFTHGNPNFLIILWVDAASSMQLQNFNKSETELHWRTEGQMRPKLMPRRQRVACRRDGCEDIEQFPRDGAPAPAPVSGDGCRVPFGREHGIECLRQCGWITWWNQTAAGVAHDLRDATDAGRNDRLSACEGLEHNVGAAFHITWQRDEARSRHPDRDVVRLTRWKRVDVAGGARALDGLQD